VGVAMLGLQQPQRDVRELNDRIRPATVALDQAGVEHSSSQRFFLDALTTAPSERSFVIAKAETAGNRANAFWHEYLRVAYGTGRERELQRTYDAAVTNGQSLGATVFGLIDSPDHDAYAAARLAEEEQSDATSGILQQIESKFYASKRAIVLQSAEDGLASMRSLIMIVFGLVLVGGLVNAFVLLRGAFREERIADARERERGHETFRSDLENQLQRGLEMEPNEEATYSVIGDALELVRPDEPVEVLVADSSQAHFRQVLSTDAGGLPACPVTSPKDCPAASSGQTRIFPSSTRLDACPYLRSRDGEARSAACIPISIAGTNTGMIHTTGPDHQPPDSTRVSELELVARKSGDRVGFLRVLARTETQARVDGLTGLSNRRTLEQRAAEVVKRGDEFVVAFADLDHFKNLNDQYGHEVGDRALRLFGRVLRDSVRPADFPARFGGEEFVVLLPDCTIDDATIVTDRLRERLATAIAGATVPKFTVSIGLAAWEAPELFDDTVARADAALLGAKRTGRDRVVTANELAGLAGASIPEPTTNGAPVSAGAPRNGGAAAA
jgi:diguanylate cyclase (GGDEF)-like protein